MDYGDFQNRTPDRDDQSQPNGQMVQFLESLNRDGFYIFENVFDAQKVNSWKEKTIGILRQQEKQFGVDHLKSIGELGIARSLLEYDLSLSEVFLNPLAEEVLARTVGDTAILHLMNGIVLEPERGHSQRRLHRDFAKDFIPSKILSLNVFVLLDDFSKENGGTEFVPGTHRWDTVPSDSYVQDHIKVLSAPAGSLAVFDSMILHRAGENKTKSVRAALNMQFTRPFIKQQIDYPNFFKGSIDKESRLAQRMGFWSVAPRGVAEYRVSDPKLRTYRAGQG
jgi:ectoine hydroxylase-related dioxygenase (phytanoyl-CoA dioxygenase family)